MAYGAIGEPGNLEICMGRIRRAHEGEGRRWVNHVAYYENQQGVICRRELDGSNGGLYEREATEADFWAEVMDAENDADCIVELPS